jgi:hypothetical protein
VDCPILDVPASAFAAASFLLAATFSAFSSSALALAAAASFFFNSSAAFGFDNIKRHAILSGTRKSSTTPSNSQSNA